MSRELIVRPEAEAELTQAFEWYARAYHRFKRRSQLIRVLARGNEPTYSHIGILLVDCHHSNGYQLGHVSKKGTKAH